MPKINLFTTYYADRSPERQMENLYSIRKNLDCSYVDKVYLILQDNNSDPDISGYDHKLQLVPLGERPTFEKLFEIANSHSKEEDFSIIANTDIFFDRHISLLKYIDWKDTALALTRWDILGNGNARFFNRDDSQDVWIFKGRIKKITGDYFIGQHGCDNRLIYEMRQSGYRVQNPSYHLKTFHYHMSQLREYFKDPNYKWVSEPYGYVKPEPLFSPSELHDLKTKDPEMYHLLKNDRRMFRTFRYDFYKKIFRDSKRGEKFKAACKMLVNYHYLKKLTGKGAKAMEYRIDGAWNHVHGGFLKHAFPKFVLGNIVSPLLKIGPVLRMYNAIYESASPKWVNVFHAYVQLPDKDFDWQIRLRNRHRVTTRVERGKKFTMQFALDYRWYSPGLSFLEDRLVSRSGRDACFADVGSNLGMRSLTALSMHRRVIMIEPNRELNAINNSRCTQNNFTDYKILEFGVSSSAGEFTFYYDQSTYLSSFVEERVKPRGYASEEMVQTRTLDDLLSENMQGELYIKVDVEGYEWEVLKGSERILKEHQPTWLIEINDKGENFEKIFNLMHGHGYICCAIRVSEPRPPLLFRITDISDTGAIQESCDFLFCKEDVLKVCQDLF
ncbi:MAG: FkbM family methyltransferase [Flavobacteriales bacterium]|nr:FkbM family methyltransferase [Flavobacteriales bacterium]